MRRALKQLMIKSAVVLQQFWRRIRVTMQASRRAQADRLAVLLQRLYRRWNSTGDAFLMKKKSEQEHSAIVIGRLYRGYLGRRRAKQRKLLFDQIDLADKCVGIHSGGITPAELDELARVIDKHLNDSRRSSTTAAEYAPTSVMSILRALLFILNGDTPEEVSTYKFGFYSSTLLHAHKLSWSHAMMLVRRRGRLLRRLRSLVRFVKRPNPQQIVLSNSCASHLENIFTANIISEASFDGMTTGRGCMLKLLGFCRAMKIVHELQPIFPDYFLPSNPDWFRQLINLKRDSLRAEMYHRTQSAGKTRIEEIREEFRRRGKKWGAIARARTQVFKMHEDAGRDAAKARKRLQDFLDKIERDTAKKLTSLDSLMRSCHLGVDIARGDLHTYLSSISGANMGAGTGTGASANKPDPKKVKALKSVIEEKKLALVETSSSIITTRDMLNRDAISRDFDSVIDLTIPVEASEELGRVQGQLMALNEIWQEFLDEIGGAQFLRDLRGDQEAYHQQTKAEVAHLMSERERLTGLIRSTIDSELKQCKDLATEALLKTIQPTWDLPTTVDEIAEFAEDRRAAVYEGDADHLNRERLEDLKIAAGPKAGILLVVDAHIAKGLKKDLIAYFSSFLFTVCVHEVGDTLPLQREIQSLFDSGKHAILFADRGIDGVSRAAYTGALNAVVFDLNPIPHIVVVDCTAAIHTGSWHLNQCPEYESLVPSTAVRDTFPIGFHSSSLGKNSERNCNAAITLGSLRQVAITLKRCLVIGDTAKDTTREILDPTKPRKDASAIIKASESESATRRSPPSSWVGDLFTEAIRSFSASVKACADGQVPAVVLENKNELIRPMKISLIKSVLAPDVYIDCHVDAVIAATITAILGLWQLPTIPWTAKNIETGCKAFMHLVTNNNHDYDTDTGDGNGDGEDRRAGNSQRYSTLLDRMTLQQLPDCTAVANKRLQMARQLLTYFKGAVEAIDVYKLPVRVMLWKWCNEALDLIDRY
jgi:hypothetical protein